VNIGDFGTAHNEDLLGLIQELDQVSGVERYRISSIEPNLLTNEIIDFVATSARFLPHFHIPLQSGNDNTLSAMRRRYRTADYAGRVERIIQRMPNACIGVDVIVGFPGESDDDFEATYTFLLNLPIGYLHVFTYSERPNTTALRIADVVPMDVRAERNHRLRILSLKKKRAFYETHLGSKQHVLFEASEHDGKMHGFTANYIKVEAPFNADLVNTIVEVELLNINADGHVDVALPVTI
jgi:threonylcarbamoyladenosine tRNA methylthiotransferase MtaB